MMLRRCAALVVERRVVGEPKLEDFLAGGSGLAERECWVAMAPHVGIEIEVGLAALAILDAVPVEPPTPRAALDAQFDPGDVDFLIAAGLLLGDHAAHALLRERDAAVRRLAWWTPAAVAQVFGRWQTVDIEAEEAVFGARKLSAMIDADGLPPSEAPRRAPDQPGQSLPPPRKTALDDLLARRTTCRNFSAATVPLADLSDLLHRVFGAQSSKDLAPGVTILKKNSPSGGGLHPIDAYLLVQRVDGLAAGLYHYHCTSHSLEPMGELDEVTAAAQAHALVAGQAWFANAPILVLMAARFERNFWKYRHHPKAWKVIQLDAGHLSQNLYISATELGHGAFVTGAINDAVAETLFGLDGITEAAVVVCGFGPRSNDNRYREFDPAGAVTR